MSFCIFQGIKRYEMASHPNHASSLVLSHDAQHGNVDWFVLEFDDSIHSFCVDWQSSWSAKRSCRWIFTARIFLLGNYSYRTVFCNAEHFVGSLVKKFEQHVRVSADIAGIDDRTNDFGCIQNDFSGHFTWCNQRIWISLFSSGFWPNAHCL